jgi:hypothetical protein
VNRYFGAPGSEIPELGAGLSIFGIRGIPEPLEKPPVFGDFRIQGGDIMPCVSAAHRDTSGYISKSPIWAESWRQITAQRLYGCGQDLYSAVFCSFIGLRVIELEMPDLIIQPVVAKMALDLNGVDQWMFEHKSGILRPEITETSFGSVISGLWEIHDLVVTATFRGFSNQRIGRHFASAVSWKTSGCILKCPKRAAEAWSKFEAPGQFLRESFFWASGNCGRP